MAVVYRHRSLEPKAEEIRGERVARIMTGIILARRLPPFSGKVILIGFEGLVLTFRVLFIV